MEDDIGANARMLLGLGLGDKRILEQVYRASINGEIISNHERQYVASLMEKHAVTVPKMDTPIIQRSAVKQVDTASQPKKSRTTLMAAVLGVAAVAVIASIVLMMPGTLVSSPSGYVEIDQSTYQTGDFMLVTGMSDYNIGEAARVNILDSNSNNIWSEDVTLRSDGSYSTIILVGQDGWIAGEHTIQVAHGAVEYIMDFTYDN